MTEAPTATLTETIATATIGGGKEGCKSVVAVSGVVVLLAAAGAAVVLKKKEN